MNNIKKIDKATAQAQSVEALSNHPNAASRYGTGGKSPTELKRRYDALAWLAINKINELLDAIGVDGKESDLLKLLYTGFSDEENEDKRVTLGSWIAITDALLRTLDQRFWGLALADGDEGKFARVQDGKWVKVDGSFVENAESHKTDHEAHKNLFEEVAQAATDALSSHKDSTDAHKDLFDKKADATKDALVEIIKEASSTNMGLMTPEQVQHLEVLVDLLRDGEDDNKVTDTIREVLSAFEEYPEGVNVVQRFLDIEESVKDLDESVTETKQQGEALAERTEKLETTTSPVENQTFANALKGNEVGSAVVLDAVSPIPHDVNVSVESKNLVPIEYTSAKRGKSVTISGIIFTVNDDGSVTLNGKNDGTNHSSFFLYADYNKPFILKKGTYIGNSSATDSAGFALRGMLHETGTYMDFRSPYTIEEDTAFSFLYFGLNKGDTREFNGETFYPMLMRGTVVEPYTAPVGDFSNVTLTKYGKNILPPTATSKTDKGITFVPRGDGTYHVHGTNDGTGNSYFDIYIPLPKGKYTGSGCPSGGSSNTYRIEFYNQKTDKSHFDYGSGVEFEVTEDARFTCQMSVRLNQKVDLILKPMIKVGAGDKVFTPYIEPTIYTPNADGTVEGVTSVYPATTLMAGNDICVLAEYNKDTNKVIENLVSAIISLGGNV